MEIVRLLRKLDAHDTRDGEDLNVIDVAIRSSCQARSNALETSSETGCFFVAVEWNRPGVKRRLIDGPLNDDVRIHTGGCSVFPCARGSTSQGQWVEYRPDRMVSKRLENSAWGIFLVLLRGRSSVVADKETGNVEKIGLSGIGFKREKISAFSCGPETRSPEEL